jgi:hypothetical protein
MGLTPDDRMSERAQVILVVTGLGAKSLAEILPGAEVIQNKTTSAEVIATEPEPTASPQIEESYEAVPASILNDLDVPAFLRKRARMNVPALEGN